MHNADCPGEAEAADAGGGHVFTGTSLKARSPLALHWQCSIAVLYQSENNEQTKSTTYYPAY